MRINSVWWLDRFAPLVFGLGIVSAGALLFLRRSEFNAQPFWLIFAATVFLAMIVALLLTRRRFESKSTALVRIESTMRLHTRLTAASAGIGNWPEPRERVRAGLHWQWQRPLSLLIIGVALVLLAANLPIEKPAVAQTHTIQTPASIAQVQQWVEKLRAAKLVEPQALEQVSQEAEALLHQPAEKWYEHSSLEAADHLRDQTGQSLHDLENDLASVEQTVNTWQQSNGEIPASILPSMESQLADALKGLNLGTLPLDARHLAQLKNFDLSKLKQLSPEQLAALKRMLEEGRLKLGECNGKPKYLLPFAVKDGKPGSGGTGGGGPTAPLTMSKTEAKVGSTKTDTISSADLSHAQLGDLQGLSKGEHKVDQSLYHGETEGGAASTGAGGETVWQNSLTPEEREILKTYYQ